MNVSNELNWSSKLTVLFLGFTLCLSLFPDLSFAQTIADYSIKSQPVNFTATPKDSALGKDDSWNPYQSRKKFKQYVTDKYGQVDDAESDVEQTPYGLSGHMTLSGEI